MKSLQSLHYCKSVIQIMYDIVKAHGGVPIPIAIGTIGIKVETKEARPDDPVGRGEGSEFIIGLPVN